MRIVTTGAKEQLIARLQCMRDLVAALDLIADSLEEARAACCD